MKNNPCLDKRCSLNACWYCMDCCHICMELAIQDYTSTLPEEKLTFKHCSAKCKAIVDHVSQLSTELHPANQIKQIPNKDFVLASIIGCVASVMSTHTIVQVNICISMERSSITYEDPMPLSSFRYLNRVFFSLCISVKTSLQHSLLMTSHQPFLFKY